MGKKVYWDGSLVEESEAVISPFSAAATYGLNVFEGVRAYWREAVGQHSVLFLESHLDRLFESAKALDINHRVCVADVRSALYSLLQTAPSADIVIRISLYVVGRPGESWSTEEDAVLGIRYFEHPSTLGNPKSVTTLVSAWSRPALSQLPMSVKAGANYINSRYAAIQARKAGFDAPILTDINGHPVEGGGANLLVRKKRTVTFCLLAQPILRGITQEFLFDSLIADGEFVIERRALTIPELYVADEILLVGTTAEITPVREVDGRQVVRPPQNYLYNKCVDLLLKEISKHENTLDISRNLEKI